MPESLCLSVCLSVCLCLSLIVAGPHYVFTLVKRTGNVCKLDCKFFRVKDFSNPSSSFFFSFFLQHVMIIFVVVVKYNYQAI